MYMYTYISPYICMYITHRNITVIAIVVLNIPHAEGDILFLKTIKTEQEKKSKQNKTIKKGRITRIITNNIKQYRQINREQSGQIDRKKIKNLLTLQRTKDNTTNNNGYTCKCFLLV